MVLKLEDWLNKVQAARSHQEIFTILDEFRKLAWTDVERASMAKLYMRVLDNMGDDPAVANQTPASSGNSDEEVWYEKM